MRFLAKTPIWVQAVVTAIMFPAIALVIALNAERLAGHSAGQGTDSSFNPLSVFFWGYLIVVPLLSWLVLLPGTRLVSGCLALIAVPIFPITVVLIFGIFEPSDTVTVWAAALLNVAVGAIGFRSIFKRQWHGHTTSDEEWRARTLFGNSSDDK
jgi:hypothetical protein